MKKHLVVAVLALTLAIPAVSHAADGSMTHGMWGVGYFRPEAPVGIRWWATPKVGVDVGVGFTNSNPDVGESNTTFLFDAGVPLVVASGDNVHFFFRPGFSWFSNGVDEAKGSKVTEFAVSGSLGVEYFFTPSFSVQVAHGLLYESVNTKNETVPGAFVDATDTFLTTEAFGVNDIGFHYYFGGR